MRRISLILMAALLFGCYDQKEASNLGHQKLPDELLDFAKANCFFWYFKKKNYDLEDIRSISGGIVEMGSYSAEQYQQVSLLVRDYSPPIQTKQNIDIDLLKCFLLEQDPDFLQSIEKIK